MNASHAAERLYRELGAPVPLALCLVRLSRHLFMTGATDAAEEAAQRAVVTLLDARDEPRWPTRRCTWAGSWPRRGREFAAEVLERADALALRSRVPELAALCLNYLAIVRVEAGEPDGLQTMRNSIALAQAGAHHEATARGYSNLAELLLRVGRLDELERCVREGLRLHARARVLVARLQPRGPPLPAAAAARRLGRAPSGPARAAGRQRRPGHAVRLQRALARAADRAARRPRGGQAARRGVAARAERAAAARPGLRGDRARRVGVARRAIVDAAREVAEVTLPRMENPGAAPFRGELLRYLERAGLEAEPFEGCPPGYDAGLRGDWRAAAVCGGAPATRTRWRSSRWRATPRRAPRPS